VPNLTNGFWVTNVTFIFTNAAVRTPTLDLSKVTIYGTNSIPTNSTLLSWHAPTNFTPAGFKVYYGLASGGPTNVFTVSSNVLVAVFFNSLATNSQWWFYATCFDINKIESLPSNQVLLSTK